jgi:ATP-dependent RNA/DNA helicase, senataxin
MFLTSRPTPATAIHPGRPSKAEDRDPVKKMLICAPSNAAIDEVAQRLKLGVRNGSGSVIIPNIVRIGHDEKMHPSIKDVSLDELVSAKLSKDPKAMDLSGFREALKEIKNKIQARGDELHGLEGNPSRAAVLEQEISSLKNERAKLGRKLDEAKDTNININRNRDSNLRKWEHQVLRDADIICTTLSGSGHNSLVPFVFETVIIDEAAQSIELSSLIPLKYRCTQCILVGGELCSFSLP